MCSFRKYPQISHVWSSLLSALIMHPSLIVVSDHVQTKGANDIINDGSESPIRAPICKGWRCSLKNLYKTPKGDQSGVAPALFDP